MRIDKGPFPRLYDPSHSFSDGFGILRPLSGLNIVTTGYMTQVVISVADALAERGIKAGVIDVFRLKPMSDRFGTDVLAASEQVVTVEENTLTGGLGSLVSELITDQGLPVRLHRLGAAEEQVLRYGAREWLLGGYGLDEASLSDRIAGFVEAG